MPLTKTDRERKAGLDLMYSGQQFIAALFNDSPTAVTFTADPGTNTLSSTGSDFINGCRVQLSNSGGGLPDGVATGTTYRTINVSGTGTQNYQLCLDLSYNRATKTGTPIAIGSTGSGTNTITEQPLGTTDDLDVWARKESLYNGSARQSGTMGAATNANPAATPTLSFEFVPSTGSPPTITHRYFAVLRGATTARGNATGSIVGFEDFITTQTITASGKTFQFSAQM